MPKITDIVETISDDELFLAKMARRHEARLLSSIRKLRDNITNLLSELETTAGGRLEGIKVNLKQSQRLHKKIVNEFEKTYNKDVDKMLGDFSEINTLVESSYRSLGEAAKFTSIDKVMMDSLRDQTYDRYVQFGTDARDRIARGMYDSVVGGQKMSTLTNIITGALLGHTDVRGRSMTMYAKGFAQDAIMNFHNQVNVKKGEDLGMTHFLYYGDLIAASRPFCITRAGKTYNKQQILSWDSLSWKGKAGPAMSERGGYNCRHHWRPVRPEWIKDEDGEPISREEMVGYMNADKDPKAGDIVKRIGEKQAQIDTAAARMTVLKDEQSIFKAKKAAGTATTAESKAYSELRKNIIKEEGIRRALKEEMMALRTELKASGKRIIKGAKKIVEPSVVAPKVKKVPAKQKKALAKLNEKQLVDEFGQPNVDGTDILSSVKMAGVETFDLEDKLGQLYNPSMERMVKNLKLSDLVGFQEVVDKEKVVNMISSFDSVLKNSTKPLVLRYQGRDILYDGYHRVNSAQLLNIKRMDFDYVDLDKVGKAVSKGVKGSPEKLWARYESLDEELIELTKGNSYWYNWDEVGNLKYAGNDFGKKIYETHQKVFEAKMDWYRSLSATEKLKERSVVITKMLRDNGIVDKGFQKAFTEGTSHMSYRLLNELDRGGLGIVKDPSAPTSFYRASKQMISITGNFAEHISHEVAHALDAYMNGGGNKFGWTGFVWKNDAPWVTTAQRDKMRAAYKKQVTGGRIEMGGRTYDKGKFIDQYESRVYGKMPAIVSLPDAKTIRLGTMGEEFWSVNVERYNRALHSARTRYKMAVDRLEYDIKYLKKRIVPGAEELLASETKQLKDLIDRKLKELQGLVIQDVESWVQKEAATIGTWRRAKKMYPELTDFIEEFFTTLTAT